MGRVFSNRVSVQRADFGMFGGVISAKFKRAIFLPAPTSRPSNSRTKLCLNRYPKKY